MSWVWPNPPIGLVGEPAYTCERWLPSAEKSGWNHNLPWEFYSVSPSHLHPTPTDICVTHTETGKNRCGKWNRMAFWTWRRGKTVLYCTTLKNKCIFLYELIWFIFNLQGVEKICLACLYSIHKILWLFPCIYTARHEHTVSPQKMRIF
jgi:hypothetical protein